MTDPTKQQAATAKTAREVIREVWNVVDRVNRYEGILFSLKDCSPETHEAFANLRSAQAALHALLDAPEGGVQRVCEAGESLWREVLELLNYANGKRDNITPRLEEILCDLTKKSNAHFDALAALRASPESVGGAGVSERPLSEVARLASDYGKQIDELKAERDALKADLAAARGEVARLKQSNDMLNANMEERAVLDRMSKPTPAYAAADLTQIARMDRIEARVAAVEKAATTPATEARGAKAPGASLPADACINTAPGLSCAGDGRRDWYVDGVRQAVCGSCGIRSTPPPASEAPISERAWLVYEGAFRFPDMVADLQGCKEDAEPIMARVYTRMAAAVLAAAERAADAPQAAES